MNAIQLLLADHKKMKKLVKQVYQTTEKDAVKRKKLFNIIKREAKLHEKMEEKFLYPYLKDHAKSRPNAFEHHEEVVLMEHMIAKLSKTATNSEEWTAKFKVFKELNDHHIKEEEKSKFKQANKLLSKELLEEIGDKMKAFKKKNKMK
jgi:hemerythrin-like domain-containing protein